MTTTNQYTILGTPIIADLDVKYGVPVYNETINKVKVNVIGNFLEIGDTSINIEYIVSMEYENSKNGKFLRIDIGSNRFSFNEHYVEDFYQIKDKVYKFFEDKDKNKIKHSRYCD